MSVPDWRIAVADFGGYVQRAAVRYGTKKDLAKAAGTTEEVICKITSGDAHEVGRVMLIRVAVACRKKLGQNTLPIMIVLVNKIHPIRVPDVADVHHLKRIATPLTSAERRVHMSA